MGLVCLSGHPAQGNQFNQFNKSITMSRHSIPPSVAPPKPDAGAVPPPAVVAFFAFSWWGPMLPSRCSSALPILWATVFGLLPIVSIEDTLVVRCVQGQMCSPVRVVVGALEKVELLVRLALLDDGDS